MIENTYLERERMGSSRTNVRIDLVTYPVCGAYGCCSRKLFRATVRARDVDLWVPSDGYPSYVSIPGLGWSGTIGAIPGLCGRIGNPDHIAGVRI